MNTNECHLCYWKADDALSLQGHIERTHKVTEFFFTFGSNHGVDYNGYIRISAPSVEEARICMFQIHGNKWSFCYTEDTLKKEYFPTGEMAHFKVRIIGDAVVPVLVYAKGYIPPLDAMYLEGGSES